jgi:hypothetical protein
MRVPNEIAYTAKSLNSGSQESGLIPFDQILKFDQVPSKYIQRTCDIPIRTNYRTVRNIG